eukprot:scaffold9102_cov157-Skeletonema_dohrnii-CCMP3373.AAC.3
MFLALAPAAAATAASGEDHKSFNLRAATDDGRQHNTKNLRGVISLASNGEDYDGPTHGTTTENSSTTTSNGNTSRSSSGGPFSNACLHGRFSYSNLIEGVASISVGVFDGNGVITEMDNIEINQPHPATGGRLEVSLPFNYGSYEVYANGRGVIYLSVGGPNSPYSDPPSTLHIGIKFGLANASPCVEGIMCYNTSLVEERRASRTICTKSSLHEIISGRLGSHPPLAARSISPNQMFTCNNEHQCHLWYPTICLGVFLGARGHSCPLPATAPVENVGRAKSSKSS